jgi:hypothetical protein
MMALCHRLLVAVQQGDADAVAQLLENTECSPDGIAAAELRAPSSADRPFEVRGADGALQVQILHDQNVHLDSSLHFACTGAHLEIAEMLLEAGCSPNLRNKQGHTPLHYAVRANNGDLVRLLMRFGADPDIATLTTKNTPLHRAAALGCGAAVDGMLHPCGIEVDATLRNKQGNTPSMEAAIVLKMHCRRFEKFAPSAALPKLPASSSPPAQLHSATTVGTDAMADIEVAPLEAQAGDSEAVGRPTRAVVYSRRRKRGAAGAASFQALSADPAALSARTVELQYIAARLLTVEENARRAVPEVCLQPVLARFCRGLASAFYLDLSTIVGFEIFACRSHWVQCRLAWTTGLLGGVSNTVAVTDEEACGTDVRKQLLVIRTGPNASGDSSICRHRDEDELQVATKSHMRSSMMLSPDLIEMVGLLVSQDMIRLARRRLACQRQPLLQVLIR